MEPAPLIFLLAGGSRCRAGLADCSTSTYYVVTSLDVRAGQEAGHPSQNQAFAGSVSPDTG